MTAAHWTALAILAIALLIVVIAAWREQRRNDRYLDDIHRLMQPYGDSLFDQHGRRPLPVDPQPTSFRRRGQVPPKAPPPSIRDAYDETDRLSRHTNPEDAP